MAHYSATDAFLIRRRAFAQVMRAIHQSMFPESGIKWRSKAVLMVQEIAEWFVSTWLSLAQCLALYSGRQTLLIKDVKFLADIQYDTRSPVVQELKANNNRQKQKELANEKNKK